MVAMLLDRYSSRRRISKRQVCVFCRNKLVNVNVSIYFSLPEGTNQAAKTESYPIPRIEDIYNLLHSLVSGGKLFTKLDLAHAYNPRQRLQATGCDQYIKRALSTALRHRISSGDISEDHREYSAGDP